MSETCSLCHLTDSHADGCPNGPERKVICASCPPGENEIPLKDFSQHVEEIHGVEIPQDEAEQIFLHARDLAQQMLARSSEQGASTEIDLSLDEVWAAVGYRAVTGQWPPAFEVGAALFVSLDHFVKALNENFRLAERVRELEENQPREDGTVVFSQKMLEEADPPVRHLGQRTTVGGVEFQIIGADQYGHPVARRIEPDA